MSAKRAGGTPPDGEQPSFEAAMKRLETIVADMETGKLNLEDMIARFEEGQSLIAVCTAKLNEVERKVEKLVKRGADVVSEPFEADDDAAGEGKRSADELF